MLKNRCLLTLWVSCLALAACGEGPMSGGTTTDTVADAAGDGGQQDSSDGTQGDASGPDAQVKPDTAPIGDQTVCVPKVTLTGGTAPYGRGSATTVVMADDIAWVGTSVGIERVDVSNPAAPTGAGWADLPRPVTALGLTETQVIATSGASLFVLDAATLAIEREIALPGPAVDLAVGPEDIWVVASAALVRVDLALGEVDRLLTLSDQTRHLALNAQGSLAAVTLALNGLVVVDLSGDKPLVVGSHPSFDRGFESVLIHGDAVWVGTPYEGLHGFDISDPTAPTFVATGDPQWGWLPGEIARVGSLVYVGDTYPNSRVRVLDISDPTAPVAVGTLSSPDDAIGIAISGDVLAVATHRAGLGLADITTPDAPQWTGRLDTDGASNSITRDGDELIVADGQGGVRTLDANTLEELSVHKLPTTQSFALRHQDIIYSLANNVQVGFQSRMELAILDATDPSAAPLDIIVLSDQAAGLTVLGDTLVVAGTGRIQAFDISAPQSPVAGTELSSGITNMVVVEGAEGPIAFVGGSAYPFATLRTIQETAPGQLEVLGNISFQSYGGKVAVRDGLAVVVGATGVVSVIDVSAPATMEVRGTARIDGKAFTVATFAGTGGANPLFAIGTTHGVIGLDISDPDYPMLLGQIAIPGAMAQVIADDRGGYLAADGDQLVSRFTVACASLDEPTLAEVPVAKEQATIALFNGVAGAASLAATVDGSVALEARHTRVGSRVSLPTDVGPNAEVEIGGHAWTVDFDAAETLLVTAGSADEPRLIPIDSAVAKGATAPGQATVRLANISTLGRVDGVLLVGGKHVPLGALNTDNVGAAVGVPAGYPARLSLTVQGRHGTVFDVPAMAPGDRITALAADPDKGGSGGLGAGSPGADIGFYVAWVVGDGPVATLSGSGPADLLASPNGANTTVRTVNLRPANAFHVEVDGQPQPGAAPLAPLGSSEPSFVAHGAIEVTLRDPDTGAVTETYHPLVGLPGDMHTVALLADGAKVAVIPNFTGSQTTDTKAELRILNAAWTEPVAVTLVDDDGAEVGGWQAVEYGVVPATDLKPPKGSYSARVEASDGVWTFDLGYFPDYGQVIYLARTAAGVPIASIQSSASTAFYWRASKESQAHVRLVNVRGGENSGAVDFTWLSPDGLGGTEAQTGPVKTGASTGWQLTPTGTQELMVDTVAIPVDLAPGTWTTLLVVDGQTHVVTEPSAPQSATARVRLANASDSPIAGWWSAKTLGTVAPSAVSDDVTVTSKTGPLTLDVNGDGAADLTFDIEGDGADPVLGLYYLGGAVPTVLVHRTESYLTVAYSNEATAWLRVVHVMDTGDITVAAPELGLEPTEMPSSSGPGSQLTIGTLGPLPVIVGDGVVAVGQALVPVSLEAQTYTAIVVYGDPAAPSAMVFSDGNGPQIANLSNAGPVNVAGKVGDEVVSVADNLPIGATQPLTLESQFSHLLLDSNLEGTYEFQMFGPYLDNPVVLVYGDGDSPALLHFAISEPFVGKNGQWL